MKKLMLLIIIMVISVSGYSQYVSPKRLNIPYVRQPVDQFKSTAKTLRNRYEENSDKYLRIRQDFLSLFDTYRIEGKDHHFILCATLMRDIYDDGDYERRTEDIIRLQNYVFDYEIWLLENGRHKRDQ